MTKHIWENKNTLFITNGKIVRAINLKTNHATETTNSKMIWKIQTNGEELIAPSGKM